VLTLCITERPLVMGVVRNLIVVYKFISKTLLVLEEIIDSHNRPLTLVNPPSPWAIVFLSSKALCLSLFSAVSDQFDVGAKFKHSVTKTCLYH